MKKEKKTEDRSQKTEDGNQRTDKLTSGFRLAAETGFRAQQQLRT